MNDMSTAQLKSNLHRLIVETDDVGVLQKVQELFTALRSESIKELSDYEKKMIEQGLEDIENGEVVSNQVMKEKFQDWINAKK